MIFLPFLADFFRKVKPSVHIGWLENLYYAHTISILLFCSISCACLPLFGRPIHCITPAEFSSSWVNYVESFCFGQTTYAHAAGQVRGMKENREGDRMGGYANPEGRAITYYAWASPLLFLLALHQWLQMEAWVELRKRYGVGRLDQEENVKKIVNKAIKSQIPLPFLEHLASKLCAIINCCACIFILTKFLGERDCAWGLTRIVDTVYGKEESVFPRVVLCHYKIRDLGQIRPYTSQCYLPLNGIFEKIFLFLWFWFTSLGIGMFLSFLFSLKFLFYKRKDEGEERRCERRGGKFADIGASFVYAQLENAVAFGKRAKLDSEKSGEAAPTAPLPPPRPIPPTGSGAAAPPSDENGVDLSPTPPSDKEKPRADLPMC